MAYFGEVTIQGGTVASGSSASGIDPVLTGAVYNSSPPTLATGELVNLQTDVNGNVKVSVVNAAPTGTAGSPATAVLTLQGITGMTPIQTVTATATSGGASYNNAIAPATPAVTTVKGSAGNMVSCVAFNNNATPVYLKFFDLASVTAGVTAATFQYMVPGNSGGAGFALTLPGQRSFANAIKYLVSGAIAAADNTAITANTVIIDISFN
jgi:hypothetical protein